MSPDKTFKEILNSLQPYPQMQFLLFSDSWGKFEDTLLEFSKSNNHSILLYKMGSLEDNTPNSPLLKKRLYKPTQERYNLQGKLYNHAFVMALPDDFSKFAKRVYTGVANGGGLYLITPKTEVVTLEQILLNSNYVAINPISLDEDRVILYARKMHGWGG